MCPPSSPPAARRARRPLTRRLAWWGAAGLAGLVIGAATAPMWLGQWALARFANDFGLRAERVQGWLWAPILSDAQMQWAGTKAHAGQLQLRIKSIDPFSRRINVALHLKQGEVSVNLKQLLDQFAKPAPDADWVTNITELSAEQMRLTVDGKSSAAPNIVARIRPAVDKDGKEVSGLHITGSADGAPLSAHVTSAAGPKGTIFTTDFEVSARALRMYWNGIEGGTLRGRYQVGGPTVQGQVNLSGGLLRVPEADFVQVRGVTGQALQQGDHIRVELAGMGWKRPVTAQAQVDLKAKNWTATAQTNSSLAGLAEALKTDGQGTLQLRVLAKGHFRDPQPYVRVQGYAKGQGKLFGTQFVGTRGYYLFEAQEPTPKHNTLHVSTGTRLAGVQQLRGRWMFGQGGQVQWQGELGGKALGVNGRIREEALLEPTSALTAQPTKQANQTKVLLSGTALGGPLSAELNLSTQQLRGTLSPDYGIARAKVQLAGSFQDLSAQVRGQVGPLAVAGTAGWNEYGLRADLSGPQLQRARLHLGRELAGTWRVEAAQLAGFTLSAGGRANLQTGTVAGPVRLLGAPFGELQGHLQLNSLQQQASLSQLRQQGRSLGPQAALTWQKDIVTARFAGLQLADMQASAQMQAKLQNNSPLLYGNANLSGPQYSLQAVATGQSAKLSAQAAGLQVSGSASLSPPYASVLNVAAASAAPTSTALQLSTTWKNEALNFELLSRDQTGPARATGRISPNNWQSWQATGRVKLGALAALAGAQAPQGQPVAGELTLALSGLGGHADINSSWNGAKVQGRLWRSAVQKGRAEQGGLLGQWRGRLQLAYQQGGAGQQMAQNALQSLQTQATLQGQLYPRLALTGPAQATLNVTGLSAPARLGGELRIVGPYQQPRASFVGRSSSLMAAGVTVPAQPLSVQANLLQANLLATEGQQRGLQLLGRWGQLDWRYQPERGQAQNVLSFAGQQAFAAFGEQGRLQLQGQWTPNFAGRLDLSADWGPYQLEARGPWRGLALQGRSVPERMPARGRLVAGLPPELAAIPLQLRGRLNVPELDYDAQLSGPVQWAGERWQLQGRVYGRGSRPQVQLGVQGTGSTGTGSGRAELRLSDAGNFSVRGQLRLAQQNWQADLVARAGKLSGHLSQPDLGLLLRAEQGQLTLSGEWAEHQVRAAGRLVLPSSGFDLAALDVSNLKLQATGPYVRAQASGSYRTGLQGQLRVLAQHWGDDTAAGVYVPEQRFAVWARLQQNVAAGIGGLSYSLGQQWDGALGLHYRLHTRQPSQSSSQSRQPSVALQRAGQLRLQGQGQRLGVWAQGPVQGQVALLPSFGGTLSTPLSPLLAGLPVAKQLQAGRAEVTLSRTGATFRTQQTRYAGQPLLLRGQLDWSQQLWAKAELRHDRSLLALRLQHNTLHLDQGRLRPATLLPLLADFGAAGLVGQADSSEWTGAAELSGQVPLGQWQKANLQARVNMRHPSGQRLGGMAAWQAGMARVNFSAQWQANQAHPSQARLNQATLQGAAWPRPDLRWSYRDAEGTLSGRAWASDASLSQLWLSANGQYAKHPLSAQLQAQQLFAPRRSAAQRSLLLQARSGQNELNLQAQQASNQPLTALAQWRLSGGLQVPEVAALLRPNSPSPSASTAAGPTGFVRGNFAGTAQHPKLHFAGMVADISTRGTLSYQQNQLHLLSGHALLPQQLGQVTLAGQVWPSLQMQTQAALTQGLGQYRGRLSGVYERPRLELSGRVGHAQLSERYGVQLGPTQLSAKVQGTAWKLQLSGRELSGEASGQVGQGATAAGLQRADVRFDTRYHTKQADLSARGRLGWQAKAGWSGNSAAWGQLGSQVLSATLEGKGTLQAVLQTQVGKQVGKQGGEGKAVQQGTLRALLPAALPVQPRAQLWIDQLDLGAFWNKPSQLWGTASAQLSGHSWTDPRLQLGGQLTDAAGELNAQLSGMWQTGAARLQLSGPKMQASAQLEGQRYQVNFSSLGLEAARLLPAEWKVKQLSLSGQAKAEGDLSAALSPERLELRQLRLRAEQQDWGQLQAGGHLHYSPAGLGGDLYARSKEGFVQLQGELPQQVRVQAKHFRLGPVTASADLTLSGEQQNPLLGGTFALTHAQAKADGRLSGHLRQPQLWASVRPQGDLGGQLYVQASDLDLTRKTLRTKLYGQLLHQSAQASIDLAGQWPKLSGQVGLRVQGLQPLTLTGQGNGSYQLAGGQLARGQLSLTGAEWLPKLQGQIDWQPLSLLAGAKGQAKLNTQLSGSLAAPKVSGSLLTSALEWNGVQVAPLSGAVAWDAGTLNAQISQQQASQQQLSKQGADKAAVVAQWVSAPADGPSTGQSGAQSKAHLRLTDLQLTAAQTPLHVSGTLQLPLEAKLSVRSVGGPSPSSAAPLYAQLQAHYRAQTGYLQTQGQVGYADHKADVQLWGNKLMGWKGDVTLQPKPAGSLLREAKLNLGGSYQRPHLSGTAELLGTQAQLFADMQGVQLRLSDGPQTAANGLIGLRQVGNAWNWYGAAHFAREQVYGTLAPEGPLSDPQAVLTLRRGDWRASGSVRASKGQLELSDGERSGQVLWDGQQLSANLDGLNLARLGLPEVSGRLSAVGQMSLSEGQSGQLRFEALGLKLGESVPYLDLPLAGDVRGQVRREAGLWKLWSTATLRDGLLNVQAEQKPDHWSTKLNASLQHTLQSDPTQKGRLVVDLSSEGKGIVGRIQSNLYPLQLGSQAGGSAQESQEGAEQVLLSGELSLSGQSIAGDVWANHQLGRADLEVSGGLFDLLPETLQKSQLGQQAQQLFGLSAQGNYRLEARADDIQLSSTLKKNLVGWQLPEGWGGSLSGRLRLQQGGGTFSVSVRDFGPPNKAIQAQVRGTKLGDDWGLGGFVGSSEFSGRLQEGMVSLQADLRALPVGTLMSAVTGDLPGEGQLTGIARMRFPLADPAAGSATVVAERVQVSATSEDEEGNLITQTLLGQGSIALENRELRSLHLKLAGAGTWDVSGQYTRNKVDLRATFDNTTFTPVLNLVPALAGLDPALQGTLSLGVMGSYDKPRATLRGQQLRGKLAGNTLNLPQLEADLQDDGLLSGRAGLQTTGTLGSQGNIDLRGLFAAGQLQQTQLNYLGEVRPKGLGLLPNVSMTLQQGPSSAAPSAQTWTLSASSISPALSNPANPAQPLRPEGSLQVTGQVSPSFDLTVSARQYNLPISLIYAKESLLSGEVRAKTLDNPLGNSEQIRLSGAADFSRLILGRLPAESQPAVPEAKQPAENPNVVTDLNSPLPEEYLTFPKPNNDEENAPVTRPFLERLWLDDLQLTASGGIRVDENLARAEFATRGLTISGTAANPLIRGEITPLRGSIFLRENEFNLTEGNIEFAGESAFPKFRLLARGDVLSETTSQKVPVGIEFKGDFPPNRAGRRELVLDTVVNCTQEGSNCLSPYTNAPYTEAELYALVATGIPNLEELPQNIGLLGNSALRTTLNVFLLGEVERTLARSFGVDYIRLTPTFSAADGVNATFSIGSYLTKDIFIQYQTDLSGNGLFDARYNTPDGRFTFRVSTPFSRFDIQTVRPSFSAEYNIRKETSLSIGMQIGSQPSAGTEREGVKFNFGVVHRFGLR